MTLSAAIIAGGFSRRMGRDKALLPEATHGTLLQRQIALVAQLQPDEILLSCRPEQQWPTLPPGARLVHDTGAHGPLGGVAALLEAATTDTVLVLAVDLGRMDGAMLARLAAHAQAGCGVIPRTPQGLEPLAAFYPTVLATDARRRVASGADLSLHGFAQAALRDGHLRCLKVSEADAALFANWNEPGDLANETISR